MQKQKIVLNFSRYKQTELLQKAITIQHRLKNNYKMPIEESTLDQLEILIKAYTATLVSKTPKDEKEDARKNLITLLQKIGLLVEKQSNGDIIAILSAGFDLSKQPKKAGSLGKAKNFRVKALGKGEINLRCQSNKNAKCYLWEYMQVDDVRWIQQTTTAAKLLLKGLEPGRQYIFRVMQIGTNKLRVYSDEIKSVVV